MDVKLSINGQTFPVYYRFLLRIAKGLTDGLPRCNAQLHYKELARALVGLGIPCITLEVLDHAGELLDQEELDELWADGDLNIRRALVGCPRFVENLTDAQVQDILAIDDPDMLEQLAIIADLFEPDQTGRNVGGRLSGMADTLLKHITSSHYVKVRQILSNRCIAAKITPAFRESVEAGFGMEKVFPTIQPEDVALLNTASLETLESILHRLDEIADDEAREKVVTLLCDHPDPYVRLEMAWSVSSPKSALVRLLDDSEPDVRAAARHSLKDILSRLRLYPALPSWWNDWLKDWSEAEIVRLLEDTGPDTGATAEQCLKSGENDEKGAHNE